MDLNTILIILGILALVILVAHGLWSSRREKTHFFKNANTFTRDKRIEQPNNTALNKQTDPLTDMPIQQANQLHKQESSLEILGHSNEAQPIQQGLNFDEINENTSISSHSPNTTELSLEQQVNEIKITLPQQPQQQPTNTPVYYDMYPSRSERSTTKNIPPHSTRSANTYPNPSTSTHRSAYNNEEDLAYRSIADIEAELDEDSVNLSSEILREQLAEASRQTTKSTYKEDRNQEPNNESLTSSDVASQSQQCYDAEDNTTDDTKQNQQDFIVLYVVAPENRVFNGTHLAQALEELGFVYSEEGIFNRHLDTLASPILYSVANIHQPGTFDLHTIADFNTIGIAIFMQLSGTTKDRVNFIYLCQDAKNLADKLKGYVLDEKQELFNEQTKTTYLARLS